MPPIPHALQARARVRRLAVAAGLGLLLLGQAAPAAAGDEGGVHAFGGAVDRGSPAEPIIGLAAMPTGTGYWTATAAGRVAAFGDAPDLGSSPTAGVADIAARQTGRGYWLAFSDGRVLAFGDSTFNGSMEGTPLNSPVVGIAATPSGRGYWLAAADGGVFTFGDAAFFGSMGGTALAAPITAMASTPTGKGYWMAAEDGGVFSFGDADFLGSVPTGGVTSMAAAPRGRGYWVVTRGGDVHAFGAAKDFGDVDASSAAVDISPRPQVDGYWVGTGATETKVHAASVGDPPDSDFDRLAQCESGGNWGARGNRYEGGLQFMNSTWLDYGGGEFAGHAYDGSREQQIEIGRRVWRARGWEPWPSCSRQIGLR